MIWGWLKKIGTKTYQDWHPLQGRGEVKFATQISSLLRGLFNWKTLLGEKTVIGLSQSRSLELWSSFPVMFNLFVRRWQKMKMQNINRYWNTRDRYHTPFYPNQAQKLISFCFYQFRFVNSWLWLFFIIRLPPELLPVSGLLTQWCSPAM